MKVKPTIDRNPTKEELKNIKLVEEMLYSEKTLPPTIQMVRNIAIEHWRSLKLFLRGKKVLTTTEKAQNRWDICKQCPFLLYDKTNPDTLLKDGRCTECGCFMNIKVHYESATCPKKKWKKV